MANPILTGDALLQAVERIETKVWARDCSNRSFEDDLRTVCAAARDLASARAELASAEARAKATEGKLDGYSQAMHDCAGEQIKAESSLRALGCRLTERGWETYSCYFRNHPNDCDRGWGEHEKCAGWILILPSPADAPTVATVQDATSPVAEGTRLNGICCCCHKVCVYFLGGLCETCFDSSAACAKKNACGEYIDDHRPHCACRKPAPVAESAAQESGETERCEGGCSEPVTCHDIDDVPLCKKCGDALVADAEHCVVCAVEGNCLLHGAPAPVAPPSPKEPFEGCIDYPRGECPRKGCGGLLYAQPSTDLSAYELDQCEACRCTWFNDPPKPWPPSPKEGAVNNRICSTCGMKEMECHEQQEHSTETEDESCCIYCNHNSPATAAKEK